jgi:thioredoxin-related protein
MKRIATLVGLLFLGGLAVPAAGQEGKKGEEGKEPAAAELLSAGLAQAKKENKRVFLVFGSPTCGWCKYLEKYHEDGKASPVIGKYLVLVKVDIVKNAGGEAMYKKYGSDRGVPAFSFLDADGKVLADSGDGRDNIGFPYTPQEVTHYFAAFRKACPGLTDAEVELLTARLKEIGPKK